MKQPNVIVILSIFLFIVSCGTLKEGFSNQKKNSSDEFLVEKKSPLVMPPDFNELPVPNEKSAEEFSDENNIKSLISKKKNIKTKENPDENDSNFEDSILKKIKNN